MSTPVPPPAGEPAATFAPTGFTPPSHEFPSAPAPSFQPPSAPAPSFQPQSFQPQSFQPQSFQPQQFQPPAFQPVGRSGGPANPLAGFDFKSVNPLDGAIAASGLLVFFFSLFGFYTAKYSIDIAGFKRSQSASASAWNDIVGGGFFGWLAMILAVAGAAALALSLVVPTVLAVVPVPPRLLVLALFAGGLVAELLAIVIHPRFASYQDVGGSASFGHGFTFYLSLLIILAATVMSFLRFRQTSGNNV